MLCLLYFWEECTHIRGTQKGNERLTKPAPLFPREDQAVVRTGRGFSLGGGFIVPLPEYDNQPLK